MSENPIIKFRISSAQQHELNDLNEAHKLVAGDDTLTQSHTLRWALSLTHKYLINPDPNKPTIVDVLRDPDSEPKTIIEAMEFILKQEEQDLNTKSSDSV